MPRAEALAVNARDGGQELVVDVVIINKIEKLINNTDCFAPTVNPLLIKNIVRIF